MRVRPVAIMGMLDSGAKDDKVIAVPIDDPRWNDVKNLKDLNTHTLREIEHFYSTYKKLQNKEVLVKDFAPRDKAEEAFEVAVKMYKDSNSK